MLGKLSSERVGWRVDVLSKLSLSAQSQRPRSGDRARPLAGAAHERTRLGRHACRTFQTQAGKGGGEREREYIEDFLKNNIF